MNPFHRCGDSRISCLHSFCSIEISQVFILHTLDARLPLQQINWIFSWQVIYPVWQRFDWSIGLIMHFIMIVRGDDQKAFFDFFLILRRCMKPFPLTREAVTSKCLFSDSSLIIICFFSSVCSVCQIYFFILQFSHHNSWRLRLEIHASLFFSDSNATLHHRPPSASFYTDLILSKCSEIFFNM